MAAINRFCSAADGGSMLFAGPSATSFGPGAVAGTFFDGGVVSAGLSSLGGAFVSSLGCGLGSATVGETGGGKGFDSALESAIATAAIFFAGGGIPAFFSPLPAACSLLPAPCPLLLAPCSGEPHQKAAAPSTTTINATPPISTAGLGCGFFATRRAAEDKSFR